MKFIYFLYFGLVRTIITLWLGRQCGFFIARGDFSEVSQKFKQLINISPSINFKYKYMKFYALSLLMYNSFTQTKRATLTWRRAEQRNSSPPTKWNANRAVDSAFIMSLTPRITITRQTHASGLLIFQKSWIARRHHQAPPWFGCASVSLKVSVFLTTIFYKNNEAENIQVQFKNNSGCSENL